MPIMSYPFLGQVNKKISTFLSDRLVERKDKKGNVVEYVQVYMQPIFLYPDFEDGNGIQITVPLVDRLSPLKPGYYGISIPFKEGEWGRLGMDESMVPELRYFSEQRPSTIGELYVLWEKSETLWRTKIHFNTFLSRVAPRLEMPSQLPPLNINSGSVPPVVN